MAGDILKQTAAPGDGRILSASVSARGRAFQVRCFCFPTQSYQTAKSHSRVFQIKCKTNGWIQLPVAAERILFVFCFCHVFRVNITIVQTCRQYPHLATSVLS